MGKPARQDALSKRGYKINAKYTNKGNAPKLTSHNTDIMERYVIFDGKKLVI